VQDDSFNAMEPEFGRQNSGNNAQNYLSPEK
jgi:hypothetical protein